jgi:hypothetical protein
MVLRVEPRTRHSVVGLLRMASRHRGREHARSLGAKHRLDRRDLHAALVAPRRVLPAHHIEADRIDLHASQPPVYRDLVPTPVPTFP